MLAFMCDLFIESSKNPIFIKGRLGPREVARNDQNRFWETFLFLGNLQLILGDLRPIFGKLWIIFGRPLDRSTIQYGRKRKPHHHDTAEGK